MVFHSTLISILPAVLTKVKLSETILLGLSKRLETGK